MKILKFSAIFYLTFGAIYTFAMEHDNQNNQNLVTTPTMPTAKLDSSQVSPANATELSRIRSNLLARLPKAKQTALAKRRAIENMQRMVRIAHQTGQKLSAPQNMPLDLYANYISYKGDDSDSSDSSSDSNDFNGMKESE